MKTHNQWILAAAVAGLFTVAAPQTNAQTAPAPMGRDSMTRGGMMSGNTPNFSLLTTPRTYDYTDLKFAERRGYSEDQIATVAKIADKSGWSFRDVLAKVARGETFGMIASEANLRLVDVMDVEDEKQMVSDYKTAYEATGMMAMKNMNGGMMK